MKNKIFEIYEDKKGEWRWRAKATNGKIVGAATEGYKAKTDAIKNAEHYGYNDKYNNAGSWEFYTDKKGEWRWRHKAMNGKIIGASSEGYSAKADALKNSQALGYSG